MNNIYDTKIAIRTTTEWEKILDHLLHELSDHTGIQLEKCSYFIEEQRESQASFGCHVDFKGIVSEPLRLELCGILCFSACWDKWAHVGAYLLYYQDGVRLSPDADDERVSYIPREKEGWGTAQIEIGEGGEWSSYETTRRWDV